MPAADHTAALPRAESPAPAVSHSNLGISLRYSAAEDNPTQSVFTITYSNHSTAPAEGVVIRSALDDAVSYVSGSATNGGKYDASSREVVWAIGTVDAGASGKTVSFRVQPIETGAVTYLLGRDGRRFDRRSPSPATRSKWARRPRRCSPSSPCPTASWPAATPPSSSMFMDPTFRTLSTVCKSSTCFRAASRGAIIPTNPPSAPNTPS